MRLVSTFCTVALISMAASAQAVDLRKRPATISETITGLDFDTAERRDLIRTETQRAAQVLVHSPNYSIILRNILKDRAREATNNFIGDLDDNSVLYFTTFNFDGHDQIFLAKNNNNPEVIFDVGAFKQNSNFQIYSVSLSPTKRWLAIALSQFNGITDGQLIIYDLQTRKISSRLDSLYISIDNPSPTTWYDDTHLQAITRPMIDLHANTYSSSMIFDIPNKKATYQLSPLFLRIKDTLNSSTADLRILPELKLNLKLRPQTFHAVPTNSPAASYKLSYVTSKDGQTIPFYVAHDPSVILDSPPPVIIISYGGFGLPNTPPAQLNAMERRFIRSGGILVWPLLRGGNELGEHWYQQAKGARNKMKTFEDLIAVAQGLVSYGFTTPEKIISVGESNGGLTAAAAALLSPGTFGLVIPISAPLDILKISVTSQVGYTWWSEYGNPSVDFDDIIKYSPVELAKNQGSTKFLILSGDEDDRVNVAHSVQFFSALKSHGGNIENTHMYIAHNTGHYLISAEDVQANRSKWLAQAAYWTYIYDYFGLTFKP